MVKRRPIVYDREMDSPRPHLVQLAMATTMLLWGVSFVASKIVLSEIPPLTYIGIRFLLASIVFGIVMLMRGRPRFSRTQHILIALIALAEPIAYFLFETYGLTLTTATNASLIIATIPLVVMLFASIFLGEPISRRALLAVGVSIVGIAALVLGATTANQPAVGAIEPDVHPSGHILGILLVFGAVVSAAAYITLTRYVARTADSVHLTIIQTWWGALVFVIIWQLQAPPARALTLSVHGWTALLFLIFGATLTAFLLYNWALRHETASTAALYINGIPVVTALTARFLLGERLTLVQIVGAVCVVVAVRLATWERRE